MDSSLQFKIVLMCSEHKSNVIRFKFFFKILLNSIHFVPNLFLHGSRHFSPMMRWQQTVTNLNANRSTGCYHAHRRVHLVGEKSSEMETFGKNVLHAM